MSTELIINASLPETRIALMENGEIQDLLIERATGKGIVGNIYKGRVTRVLPGMQAAFVDIGLEKAAFLYVDDVFVHSQIWEAEEAASAEPGEGSSEGTTSEAIASTSPEVGSESAALASEQTQAEAEAAGRSDDSQVQQAPQVDDAEAAQWESEVAGEGDDLGDPSDDDENDDDQGPVGMAPPPGEGGEGGEGGEDPQGTVRPAESNSEQAAEGGASGEGGPRRRHRRGRRGGRFRKRNRDRDGNNENAENDQPGATASQQAGGEDLPDGFQRHDSSEEREDYSDRSVMSERGQESSSGASDEERGQAGRPESGGEGQVERGDQRPAGGKRPEFKENRSKDRRIKSKAASKPARGQANIQDLLKEGQEVIVQVAKDPIATKGARLTCHISLPGRHLVCMPTIDHVGVSRRIERDDERRKLREYVERARPKGLGFIVRTASGRGQSEKRIKQDVDYLSRIWNEIREKASQVSAPALVYEDLNSVLRAIRDWVTDDIDKIVVDSRYHFNEIQRFVSHFMPSLKQKVDLYHGDVPIFDAYNISTELSRAMERKVWLKSGGYIVVDQAEALVAIDVNTGRFVGKKNLEDTILKTNLEAVQEIAYQLRLRNCGGIIILDLIDMEKEENKQRVYRALEEALKKDRARPTILKISELGLVEMTRKRTRDTMVRALCESCSSCEGKGFVKSKVTVAYEILRELERIGIEREIGKVLVQANSDVIDVLAIDERDTLDQLERRYRKPIYLQAVMDYSTERFEVTGDKLGKGERAQVQLSGDRDRNGRDRNGERNDRSDRGDRDRGGRNRRDRGRDRDRNRNRHQSGGGQQGPAVDAMSYVGPSEGGAQDHASLAQPAGPMVQPITRPQSAQGGDEDVSEEDRLAFLRAQAAQDAALARAGGTPAGDAQQRAQGDKAPREGGGGEGRGRRGRRGGRHRRGRDTRAPQQAGPRGPLPVPNPTGGAPRGDQGGGDTGGSSSDGGGSSGGGGDHSTPPVS